ncbi:TetR/AcrR family transcriptional regulator [Paenibacillus sp. N1-5-1-14]|uniref:TetR/AcrR family transcriptional regulator n=1 Tax=Paenibacillus radicibacter TaxID=2972488 RepID=UPI0021596B78|nr:TetR/AcrR family transcriptional regulator [Paenibacillus radicibacter]MCR8644331.1 TetR/AcrR family transcriptional regulator [Paenibacillus radicibacter]
MKQEERRQQTTQLLLDTTKSLIHEKGCEAITMKDLMERSGLSKGAIFHYIKSKDEIFAWVLQDRLEETNRQFIGEVAVNPNFTGPMQRIADRFTELTNPEDITNKVLMYLLGKEEQPLVADALRQYYERSVILSKEWITTGQQAGVIPDSIDADQVAEMFVLLTTGLRVRSTIPTSLPPLSTHALTALMTASLIGK